MKRLSMVLHLLGREASRLRSAPVDLIVVMQTQSSQVVPVVIRGVPVEVCDLKIRMRLDHSIHPPAEATTTLAGN